MAKKLSSDTTLFGATSGPSGAAMSYLRWGKQTYANVRPARWMPGCDSPLKRPEEVDFVIKLMVDKVTRLREMSPLYEMAKEGIDLKSIEWTAH